MNDLSTGVVIDACLKQNGTTATADAVSTIDQRLENWSRHYRDRLQQQCCGSAEGKHYHAPWRQWVPLSEVRHSIPIDWQDAERVERAWKKMLGRPKLILKYVFMADFPSHIVCRKVGIKIQQLKGELFKAKQSIRNILDGNN